MPTDPIRLAGKAKASPSTLHMDGTSPVTVYVQATTDELRAIDNQRVEILHGADPQPDTAPEGGLPTAQWLEQWCVENRGWKPQDALWQEWDDGLDAIRAWRALNGAPATLKIVPR